MIRITDTSKGNLGNTIIKPAFDSHEPPSRELIDDCIHCGFCLPTCPTYLLWGEEMDSPRGRIYLMKAALNGDPLTDSMVLHWDLCLGCMACVTACPSGVKYDRLIEDTRYQVERRYPRALADRAFRKLIFEIFPHPNRLRAILPLLLFYRHSPLSKVLESRLLSKLIPSRLRNLLELAPEVDPSQFSYKYPEKIPAKGKRRAKVGLITGCVQRIFFSHVNRATINVLSEEGCEVYIPRSQGCCGALALHSGNKDAARDFARSLINAFEGLDLDYIVINAAGCGSTLKEYALLLQKDAIYRDRAKEFAGKIVDVSELLVKLGPVAKRHPLRIRVAYHDACHLRHAQGIRKEPRELLTSIPELELVEPPEADICCGSAGIYNLLNPEAARELGERKLKNISSTGAKYVASANPGCTLQISSIAQLHNQSFHIAHPVEYLEASILGKGIP